MGLRALPPDAQGAIGLELIPSTSPFQVRDAGGRVLPADEEAIAASANSLVGLLVGGTPWNVTAVKTGAYAAAVNDLVQADSTGGGFTVTFPSSNAASKGRAVAVKNVSSSINFIALAPAGGQTIDGKAAGGVLLRPYDVAVYISDGAGNWNAVLSAPEFFSVDVVANLPTPGTIGAQTRVLDGAICFVQSQRAFYAYRASGVGWDRFASDTSYWLAQTDFHISDAGTADGTGLASGSPITPAEFALRIGNGQSPFTSAGTITINLHGTTVALDVLWTLQWSSANQIVIQGDVINQGAANVLSAVTVRAQGTGQTLRVTAPAQAYTPGQYVLITSSVNPGSIGSLFPICADLTGGVAELGPGFFYDVAATGTFPAEVVPVIGDGIQVVNFTNLTGSVRLIMSGVSGSSAGLSRAIVQKLLLTGTGFTKNVLICSPSNGRVAVVACAIAAGSFALDNSPFVINCIFKASANFVNRGGLITINGGLNSEPANENFNNCVLQGGFLTVGTINVTNGTYCQINALQMSSQASAGRTLLKLQGGAIVSLTPPAAISFNVAAAGIIIANLVKGFVDSTGTTWTAAIITNGTASATPFLISSQTGVPTFTVATGVWSAGAVVATLASLDAATPGGFGGKLFDPRSGCGLVKNDAA